MALHTEARPRRLIPRYPWAQQVLVRGGALAPRSYPARDVSQGGFFLATVDAFELFSDVELQVVLPNGESASLPARIVHILTPEKAQSFGVPAGVGVQFEGLNEQQRRQVQTLVAWARANDPRPRIPRRKPAADLTALQSEPMLAYLFEHVDGQRDPEALAEELGIEVGSIERMLRELVRFETVELISATSPSPSPSPSPALPSPQPRAASTRPEPKRSTLPPQQKQELSSLEKRLARDNLYITLDVPENAKPETIREKYQTLSAALRSWSASATDTARIERAQNQLREAFGVLSSPHKRSEYDEYLARARELSEAEAQRSKPKAPAASPPAAASSPKRVQATRAEPPPTAAATRALAAQRSRGAQTKAAEQAPLGAAAQILGQAEQAHAAGKFSEANKNLQLLTAMSFDDAKIRARVAQLKTQVSRALAVDFEKQAAYEEKQQHWAQAARSWLRVAEGRPKDHLPLQRAALAQMQAGADLKQVLELAKRAVELAQGDPEAHRTLARVYVAAGMQANARRELEAAQRCAGAPAEDACKEAAKPKPERGLFKRLMGREAPN